MLINDKLKYKLVMDDGPDLVVLADVTELEFGITLFWMAAKKWPDANVYLKDGARIVNQRVAVAPPPVMPEVPDNRTGWDVYVYRKRREYLGYLLAIDKDAALDAAVVQFKLRPDQRGKLELVQSRR